MKTTVPFVSLFLLAATALPLAAGEPDPVQAATAKAFTERKESTVKLTVTRKVKGKDQTFEASALSLDGKDLLVTSLGALESGGGRIMAQVMNLGGEGQDQFDAKGELTRIAMLRADSTEAEADLVLTDEALDLAFVRVRPAGAEGAATPAAPPLATAAPALLDPILAIGRKGPDFQRTPSAELLQIAALIRIPRELYLPSQPLPGGTPVYNLAGELLGLVSEVNKESVIVPAAAISKVAATIPAKAE